MNDFKDCYQSAVENMHMLGMKEIHIDASSCMDESRHSRWVIRQMRRTMTTAFSAACLLFVCGFGTVKAAEYIENVIKVNEWGFESADAATMARNEAGTAGPCIISEEVKLPQEDEAVPLEEFAAKEGTGHAEASVESGGSARVNEVAEMADVTEAEDVQKPAAWEEALPEMPLEEAGLEKQKAIQPEERLFEDGAKEGVSEQTREGEIEEITEMEVKNYISFEEFEKNEDIVFPQPLISTGTGGEDVNVTVCGDWAMARYDIDGKVIWVERTDYAKTTGHASSKVFPGGVCNERQYTTAQGYVYTLVDSVKETEEEQLQIHGAVTVGTYEAYIDFMGYTEEEAIQIIESIDLSEYE